MSVEIELAAMAQRVRDSHRRDAAESIAKRIFRESGSVTAEQVEQELGATYVGLPEKDILDRVARKAAAALGVIDRDEAETAERAVRSEAKVQAAAEALRAAEDQRDALQRADFGPARQHAHALLSAAIEAGGNPDIGGSGDTHVLAEVAHAAAVASSGAAGA